MYIDRPKFFRSYAFWKGARAEPGLRTLESGRSHTYTHSQYTASAAPSLFTEKQHQHSPSEDIGFARQDGSGKSRYRRMVTSVLTQRLQITSFLEALLLLNRYLLHTIALPSSLCVLLPRVDKAPSRQKLNPFTTSLTDIYDELFTSFLHSYIHCEIFTKVGLLNKRVFLAQAPV